MSEEIGNTFYTFRTKDRKFTVKQVSADIMSESSLRRFELGQTSPYLATVLPLLDKLRITPSEFFARQNNFNPTQVSAFYSSVAHAYNDRDVIKLDGMLSDLIKTHPDKPTDLPFGRLDKITIQAASGMLRGQPFPIADINFVMNYLRSQRNWFNYDLNMLRYFPVFLPAEDLIWLAQNIFAHALAYINVLNNADLVSDIVLSVTNALIISAKDYDEAQSLLSISHHTDALKGKLEFSVHRKALEAAIKFHQGDRHGAEEMHAGVLATLKEYEADWDIRQVEAMWPLLTKKD